LLDFFMPSKPPRGVAAGHYFFDAWYRIHDAG